MDRRSFSKAMGIFSLSMLKNSEEIFSKKLIKPRPLIEGDTVGFIAPGSAVKPEKFQNALQNMKLLGLKVKYNETCLKSYGFLSATDEERINDIHKMFSDKEVKAIWCLRGGYGCTRIIPYLDYKLIRNNPKILIGYSDVTALLSAIEREAGLMGVHGVVASSSILSDYTFNATKQMLFKMQGEFVYKAIPQSDLSNTDIYTIRGGTAEGKLIGGNLSLLVSLIGTKYSPSYKNKIVFIEEVGEKPYRVDRMLTQLLNGTDLKKAAGIIFGVFSDCEAKPDELSFTLKETIVKNFEKINIPSMYGFPFGHVTDITPFPIGAEALFSSDSMEVRIKL